MPCKPRRKPTPVEELCRSAWRNYVQKRRWAVVFCALLLVVGAAIAVTLFRLPLSALEGWVVAIGSVFAVYFFGEIQGRGAPWRTDVDMASMLHKWAMSLRFNLRSEDLEEYEEDIQKLLAGNLSAYEEAKLLSGLIDRTAHLKRAELTTTGDDEAS